MRSDNSRVGGFRAGSAGLCVAALTAFGVAGLAVPAYADETVTVQGTAFPDPARASLSFVGCADLYQRTDEPLVPTIGAGPGRAPSGTRSLGWDLAGGNAVGSLFPVGSMLATGTASMAVNSVGHATGVAYAGYQEPAEAGTSLLWLGRSELSTPGGAWQTVDAATRLYTWAKYDMTTRRPVAPGPGVPTTVAGFVAAHGGDGPGFYTIGFGCDGTAFSMDLLRVGGPGDVTTYDLEGLRTMVTISAWPGGAPGGEVTITGRLRTLTGDPIPHATMLLERRSPGSPAWTPVLVADVENGGAKVTVRPDERALYRWRFVERPLAEGSTSMALVLDVLPPLPTDAPSPTDSPSSTSSSTPSTTAPTEPSAAAPTPSDPGSPSGTGSTTESSSGPASVSSSASATPGVTPSDGAGDTTRPSESDSHGAR